MTQFLKSLKKAMSQLRIALLAILVLGSSSSSHASPLNPCSNVVCEAPTDKAGCSIVPQGDYEKLHLPPPTGVLGGECCPLWKCTEKDGTFTTLHGVKSAITKKDRGLGSEVVRYSKNSHRTVTTSVASGSHDAVANAGGEFFDFDDAMKTLDLAMKDFNKK